MEIFINYIFFEYFYPILTELLGKNIFSISILVSIFLFLVNQGKKASYWLLYLQERFQEKFMNNQLTIKVLNPNDPKADPNPYVEVLGPYDDPYLIEDMVKIVAKDSHGNDISDRVVYDSSAVDFTKSGDYPVEVSVMDNNFNMATATFTVHMLDEQEVRDVEAGRPLERETDQEKAAKEEKRAEILDWAFYIAIIVMFIGFVVFTFMDAF